MKSKNIQPEPLFRSVGNAAESVPEVCMATAVDTEKQSEGEINTCKG